MLGLRLPSELGVFARLGYIDTENADILGHMDKENADILGHTDTKNVDFLGHTDTENEDILGHMDTENEDKKCRSQFRQTLIIIRIMTRKDNLRFFY